MPLALAVHGGAYSIPHDLVKAHEDGCRNALEAGWAVLRSGQSALLAVEAAVRVLEDDPVFDAGTGSHLNRDGIVECDAAIMDGKTLAAGAVGALADIANPVSVARALLERGNPVFIAGPGALRFAIECGIPKAPEDALVVPRERERWIRSRGAGAETAGAVFGGESDASLGTVGAVALDAEGHVAAATSTGGTPNKLPGRVGDCPLIGCGTYADDRSGAISCTGWGESIIRGVLARRVAEHLERGFAPQFAAKSAIFALGERIGGLAGVIVVAPVSGRGGDPVGVAFNTSHMARGVRIEGREPAVAVFPE